MATAPEWVEAALAETSPGLEPVTAEAFETVRADFLRCFPELVERLGGDPERLLREAGVDPGRAGTYRDAVLVLEAAATQLNCPDFGLRLAALQGGGGMFGPLGLAMKNSRTFGEALDYVSTHINAHSLAARVWLKRSAEDGGLFSGHDILLDRAPNKSQAMEQILLVGHLAAMEITGGRARVRRVHFRHQPISPLRTYRRYFGCEVLFGQTEDGVFFSERDLAAPILDPDAGVYEQITAYIDAEFGRRRPPLHAQVRGVVMQRLGGDDCRNAQVAAELGLHPQTMLRRLKAEGASFQTIKDEVRRDLMLYYLRETDLDFGGISERLGFAEQSVMTRTCRRWFAASPTELRAQRGPRPHAG